jgi:hypothetical protein
MKSNRVVVSLTILVFTFRAHLFCGPDPKLSSQRFGVRRPGAARLCLKSSFIGFGFASCCEAWLCPAVCER